MRMDKPKIMIGIEIDGQKLVLDEEAAKGLYEMLHGMFGKKVEKELVPYPVINYPISYPAYTPDRYVPPYVITSTGTLQCNGSAIASNTF